MEDFDRVLLQSNCLHLILNLHYKSSMKHLLSGSILRFLHNAYHKSRKTCTNKFFTTGQALSSGGLTINSNKDAVFHSPLMFKQQKMVRTRKKCGVRKTIECIRRCLNTNAYPHVLKWKDKSSKIFSILFKHKKSPDWSHNHLAFFKELDSISVTKYEKYKNETDPDQAGKRRCKANLRKLCEDGLLKWSGEKQLNKCTRLVYYKFTDAPNNEQSNFQTENNWYDAPLIYDGNLNYHFSDESVEMIPEAYGSYDLENVGLSDVSNASAENEEYGEESVVINMDNDCIPYFQTNNINDSNFEYNYYSNLNYSSSNMELMPALEESNDIKELLGMTDDQAIETADNDILWSEGCNSNLNYGVDINDVVNAL